MFEDSQMTAGVRCTQPWFYTIEGYLFFWLMIKFRKDQLFCLIDLFVDLIVDCHRIIKG